MFGSKNFLFTKYKGKTVEVISDASSKTIRIFFNGILIKEIPLKDESL